jgi:tetratricopeptide (TPR) repeat protein
MMMRYSMISLFLFLLPLFAAGQDIRLAQQYYHDGEYEKASLLYEQLLQKNPNNEFYFDRYVECLIVLEDFNTAERVIKRQLRQEPNNSRLYVAYGRLFERQYKEEAAEKQYRQAIETLQRDRLAIIKLANAFSSYAKYDLAIEAYERGAQLLRDKQIFAYYLADLYRRKNDVPKMIEYYLNTLDSNPERLDNLKTMLQRSLLLPEDYNELQKQLYTRIQSNENADYYPELLAWVFIQRKDYRNALRQLRALDRRLRENGGRVFQLGQIAANDKDYDAAIEAFDYIVEQKGPSSSYYLDAKRESLQARRNKLTDGFAFTREELQDLQKQYLQFLNEFGRSRVTAPIILELAKLEALYLGNLDQAILLLTQLIEYPNVDRNVQAHAKLDLADYYLIKGEIWEATLLYSQVDKAFKDDALGHEARFRNARLSYFTGDFQWAQAQFDILKASTSKLIANDALDLSIFIMDNLGLDSTATALRMYANADLLVFQNQFDQAFATLEELLRRFPDHSLEDDVLYLKASIYKKKRDYIQAAAMLQTIIDRFPEEIRADNALYELAQLYEQHLGDIPKAMELYETLFIDYSGSTFAVDARKRYRALRGDNVQ